MAVLFSSRTTSTEYHICVAPKEQAWVLNPPGPPIRVRHLDCTIRETNGHRNMTWEMAGSDHEGCEVYRTYQRRADLPSDLHAAAREIDQHLDALSA